MMKFSCSTWAVPLTAAVAACLTACGGGGGSAGGAPPTVSSVSAGQATYSQPLLITAQGNNLDQGVAASSAGCRNMVLSTTAPNISNASTAYFRCTVSGVGAQSVSVTRTSDGGVLGSAAFTVAVPQVTMAISNGAGVNGSLVLTLDPARAPVTVDNFLAYVNAGFYDSTVFHRHGRQNDLSPFVLQGGGYSAPVSSAAPFPAAKATRDPIALEVGRGLSNVQYSVAMARTSALNSATSEFFINTVDNVFLDTAGGGYAVFGTVTAGTALVNAMVAAPCSTSPLNFGSNSPDCVPSPNLVITRATQTR